MIELKSTNFYARIAVKGGTVHGLWWTNAAGVEAALLRPALAANADAVDTAGFPLVPFGNRLGGNQFQFAGKNYSMPANSALDPCYLHGDGWLNDWQIEAQDSASVTLLYKHDGSPYRYEARQVFTLGEAGFTLDMSVTNLGAEPLPFGLGWHPYFPLTAGTTLQFGASHYWTEGEGSLPDQQLPAAGAFDFSQARALPDQWLNNGFSCWDGQASIAWPDTQTLLKIHADPLFRHLFLYLPFEDEQERPAYFCFEPMSHQGNAHNLPDLGDLSVLARGETLQGRIRLEPQPFPA